MLLDMTIKGWFGPKRSSIHAVKITEHFAIHPTPHVDQRFLRDCWSATHVGSGLAVVLDVPLTVAVDAAIAFEKIGADWEFTDQAKGQKMNGAYWLQCGRLAREIKRQMHEVS